MKSTNPYTSSVFKNQFCRSENVLNTIYNTI